jgi:hypothetical protein
VGARSVFPKRRKSDRADRHQHQAAEYHSGKPGQAPENTIESCAWNYPSHDDLESTIPKSKAWRGGWLTTGLAIIHFYGFIMDAVKPLAQP